MLKKIKDFIAIKKKRRELEALHIDIIHGARFLRIINDEIKKLDRKKRRQWLESLYKDGKIADDIVEYCELKSEYFVKAMKGQLKLYKKKKAEQKKANKKTFKETKKTATEVVRSKPNHAIKAEETKVDGVAVDGLKLYNELKKKEKQ